MRGTRYGKSVSITGEYTDMAMSFQVLPIGSIHSTLKDRCNAPRQGWEGAPNARLEIFSSFVECLDGIHSGQDIWVFTWLHEAQRSVMKVHPRGDIQNSLAGVFATRSPDRPNPIGLHRVQILGMAGDRWLHVQGLEAIDGTPIIDIKPVIERNGDF
jgi:tRNA-Thr(GGU) m(6)t(6)A37 methyltransferase TsaA